jgi:hypothetical protein
MQAERNQNGIVQNDTDREHSPPNENFLQENALYNAEIQAIRSGSVEANSLFDELSHEEIISYLKSDFPP